MTVKIQGREYPRANLLTYLVICTHLLWVRNSFMLVKSWFSISALRPDKFEAATQAVPTERVKANQSAAAFRKRQREVTKAGIHKENRDHTRFSYLLRYLRCMNVNKYDKVSKAAMVRVSDSHLLIVDRKQAFQCG